ncbi:MAG: DUF3078 domain-containing protein [Bacteroidales bacterium]|jgi:hypothetical protein|nr:DUF3078 domain-containing protein [Bacteroidales bacterium]
MSIIFKRLFSVLLFAGFCISGSSQDNKNTGGLPGPILDTLKKGGYVFSEPQKSDSIGLDNNQAIEFLKRRLRPQYWKDPADPLRIAIGQLIFEVSHNPYDSAEVFLRKYPFDSLNVGWDKFYIWEPLNLTLPESGKDTSILIVIDTLKEVTSDYPGFPYTYYEYPYQSDSVRTSVNLLMNYLEARDSSIVYFTGIGNEITPIWLNSKSDMMKRYWLKTDLYDSVTVWIGSQSKNTIALYLENGISFIRPAKQQLYTNAKVDVQEIDRSKLQEIKKITIKPQYWKYRSEASFALNQASLTNWVKGGESSVSTSLDITGFADYSNKQLKITSNNFARLKYGLIWSDENGIRKNLDLLETNSKLNHKAFGKFDFSAILLFKTQIAKGFTYPTDTTRTLVSKFMNPGILTVGLGLDYKPDKFTSINFSPLSYKGTFVTDTTGIKGKNAIDQTKYGVPADKRAKNEPGASFMITHEFKPIKKLAITNRLQLFTNYINNPQNIDIDWEMIATANLNWFTDVRLNTHLIFDDDTKSLLYDKDKNPVMGPDGKQKKTARIQFKELLGFSFIFRF